MTVQPTNLSLFEGVLTIEWSDKTARRYDVSELRNACPCATCNTERERSEQRPYEPAAAAEDLNIRQMLPVGNYAYNIRFTDGHETGIFTLELLQKLGREKKP